jgi:hypothetical protein
VLLTSSKRSLANDKKCLKEIIDNMLSQIDILILNILIIDFKHEVVNLKLSIFSHKQTFLQKLKNLDNLSI